MTIEAVRILPDSFFYPAVPVVNVPFICQYFIVSVLLHKFRIYVLLLKLFFQEAASRKGLQNSIKSIAGSHGSC